MSAPFIVLEGLDGVGKTTLAAGLAGHLGGVVLDTPGPELRRLMPEFLEGLRRDVDARVLAYLASGLAQGREACRLADSGTPVVLDRYWCSSLAYGRAFGATVNVDELAASFTRPDLTILLTIDDAERRRRLVARGIEGEEDRLTQEAAFRELVLAGYRAQQPAGLGVDVEVHVSGAGVEEALGRVVVGIAPWSA